MQISKLDQNYSTWEKNDIERKIRINFKSSSLITIISIFNAIFFIGVTIWIGFGINWNWDYDSVRGFILDNKIRSIGWGVFLSLLIFTVINGFFFIFIYFKIFHNIIFIMSAKSIKKDIKVISLFIIICILFYFVGTITTILGFSIFIYFSSINLDEITLPYFISAVSWNFIVPIITSIIPFAITFLTFFSLRKNHTML